MLHVVEPEVSGEVTDEVAAEALQRVLEYLKETPAAATKAIETITNPAALTVITNPEVTVTDKGNGKAEKK